MRQTLFQYRDGNKTSCIYKKVNPFYVLLKKFFTHNKAKKVTFRLDNLYVCRIKSLCNHPDGMEMGEKILWANNGSYLDPTTGNRYFYYEDLEDYINIGDHTILAELLKKLEDAEVLEEVYSSYLNIKDKTFLTGILMKLEDVGGVKKRYPLYLSIKQIEELNEKLKTTKEA